MQGYRVLTLVALMGDLEDGRVHQVGYALFYIRWTRQGNGVTVDSIRVCFSLLHYMANSL